ncbi:hypothetical protein GH714_003649 [Hevea brasiliensis]|uniref:K-box domain-containing protein n=1 Tax=Hevea brasiliensis TaxID=3981 RepID=A0A6A6LFN2_HEVBR|nr:hypothetical protein GH714_003649 [Hevea brasiliensis]
MISTVTNPQTKYWYQEKWSYTIAFACNNNRQMMGEELSGLSIKELQNLESRLEMSLRGVRTKKDQILMDEIQELNRKGNLIHQENVELYKKQTTIALVKKQHLLGMDVMRC